MRDTLTHTGPPFALLILAAFTATAAAAVIPADLHTALRLTADAAGLAKGVVDGSRSVETSAAGSPAAVIATLLTRAIGNAGRLALKCDALLLVTAPAATAAAAVVAAKLASTIRDAAGSVCPAQGLVHGPFRSEADPATPVTAVVATLFSLAIRLAGQVFDAFTRLAHKTLITTLQGLPLSI